MKKRLQKYSENFLEYLFDVRGYSETTIVTYEVALRQMMQVSHMYEEESTLVLDITPFRFQIVNFLYQVCLFRNKCFHFLL